MGDRSYAIATVYACPADKRAEVLAVLDDAGLRVGYIGPNAEDPDPTRLYLGEDYTAEEVSLGTVQSLAGELVGLGATFYAAQDPHYTTPGDVHANVPGLGRYDEDTGVEAQLIVREETVLRALDSAETIRDARRTVRRLYGWPVLDVVLRGCERGHVLSVELPEGEAEGVCSCGWGYASPDADALADAFLDHAAQLTVGVPAPALSPATGELIRAAVEDPETPVVLVDPQPAEPACEGSEGIATPYGPDDTWPAS